ncbi:NADH-quinone oxidoreductase subunit C [Metabacillus sp. 113a]|uniref:NADH-quinone oxidoreductase subunit C n=1 Tax=Metabacillus sp. 113a TaxID=3404706 RepID=UPI003CEF4850
MADEKEREQLKKEAAARAKEEAKKKLEERNRNMEAAVTAEANQERKAEALELAKQKAAAAAKAKAAALAKQKRQEGEQPESGVSAEELAKQKAAAAAKAKAAALAKQKRQEGGQPESGVSAEELAKQKAAAAAKAKAAALAKASRTESFAEDDAAKAKAKAVAAAKAKAAAAAKAKLAAKETPEPVKPLPSVHEPRLNRTAALLREAFGDESVEEASINRLSKEVPTITVRRERYLEAATLLRHHKDMEYDYLSEMHGTDFQTHMEIYLYLFSYTHKQSLVLKTKLDRGQPEVESVAYLWRGADWPERETFDLLGIHFTNHPNLKRIMLPDEWVGHPLRKDYEPYDVEV